MFQAATTCQAQQTCAWNMCHLQSFGHHREVLWTNVGLVSPLTSCCKPLLIYWLPWTDLCTLIYVPIQNGDFPQVKMSSICGRATGQFHGTIFSYMGILLMALNFQSLFQCNPSMEWGTVASWKPRFRQKNHGWQGAVGWVNKMIKCMFESGVKKDRCDKLGITSIFTTLW